MPSRPDSANLVIFGAGGDLTRRKLIPALYNLFLDGWLPERVNVLGIDKKELGREEFREGLREGIDRFSRRERTDPEQWRNFVPRIADYVCADFADRKTFDDLSDRLAALDKEGNTRANRIFYLATPPSLVETIVEGLGRAGLARDRKRARIVVEKPFGRDLSSAKGLDRMLGNVFDESQIYRIDHYLGKETVQNILAFRFANALFEPVWDRRYIDYVRIDVAEDVGVENRGAYYDHAGALRDMVQNHLLQILCLIAMEPPVSFQADEIRNKKVDVLKAIRPVRGDDVHRLAVRGQYGAGWTRGERVSAYREEPGVSPESTTETFAALKFFIDNWRWQGVPFYLRTGKRLARKISEVSIQFRPVPHQSFPSTAVAEWYQNRLVIGIQPEETIVLRFQAKQPGMEVRLGPVEMRFGYRDSFRGESPEAYETLLLDVLSGDATLFMRGDQIEAAWAAITPVLEAWAANPPADFPNYQAGLWGPEKAGLLLGPEGPG